KVDGFPLTRSIRTRMMNRHQAPSGRKLGRGRKEGGPMSRAIRLVPILALLLVQLAIAAPAHAAAGQLDTSFGGDGKVTTHFASTRLERAAEVAVEAIRTVVEVVTTAAAFGTDAGFALARYNPDGSLDTTFGGDGKVTTHFA